MAGFTRNTSPPSAGSQPVMPLAMARRGETVELVDVRGGRGLHRRLAEMGLGPGSRFVVETSGRPGPFVIRVKGSRLVLGHGMVTRVFVRPVR
ncbi:MAG: FeoA family protein [bacterium]